MNNYNEVKKSFGTQAEKFASYHMSKAEYTDYLIRSIQARGNEHALEVAAGPVYVEEQWLLMLRTLLVWI